jgi:hypothetical protein
MAKKQVAHLIGRGASLLRDADCLERSKSRSGSIRSPRKIAAAFCVATATGLLWQAGAVAESPMGGHVFPVFPMVKGTTLSFDDPGPLINKGGPVMTPVTIYSIFWAPPKLQDGTPTLMPSQYQNTLVQFANDYIGHGIHNNNTQYFMTVCDDIPCFSKVPLPRIYIQNDGVLGPAFVEKTAYPKAGCTYGVYNVVSVGNCINDSQIQQQIINTMNKNHWTADNNTLFIVYTSPGEGSCLDSKQSSCAYLPPKGYCAYHNFIPAEKSPQNTPIIYAVVPYGIATDGKTFNCVPPTASFPNGPATDTAVSLASHEISEAITDPFVGSEPAWVSSWGNEIGDLCRWQYGTASWNNGTANQMWNGHFYNIQMEWSNHAGACVQLGP